MSVLNESHWKQNALSHPIGAVYNTHHGMTNAVVMPPCLDLNRPMIEDKIGEAADYLGINGGLNGFYDYVLKLRSDLGVPDKLCDLEVGDNRIAELTEMALADPSCGGNPVELNSENVEALFRACI